MLCASITHVFRGRSKEITMKKRLSSLAAALLIAIAAMPIAPAGAAEPAGVTQGAPDAQGAAPCCGVVSIDQTKGTVTIKNLQTGKLTTVRIRDAAVLRQLKVGLKVLANGLPAR
jgi:Cu/Ag efflux protein CusF